MTTKLVIICTVLGLLNSRLYAQQNTQAIEKVDYAAKVEKYRKMKSGGAALTVIGSVLVVAGMATMINSMEDLYETDDTKATNGAICALVGYASLGAGIPLWIVGGVQHKKYSAKLKQVSVKINATPQSQGLTLTYRF
jgi:hypothetical protein